MAQDIIAGSGIARLKRGAALCALAVWLPQTAFAASNIATAGTTYPASGLGSSVNPVFQAGTLRIDTSNQTYSQNFTLDTSTTNTIDQTGNTAAFSGVFSDAVSGSAGNLVIANSGAGGGIVLAGVNTYTGTTTINSGAVLALTTGTIATSSSVNDAGTFDISQTAGGASIVSLAGSGTVTLGSSNLSLSAATGSFTGVISGTGSLALTSGTQTLGGENTYTGGTTITLGTLQVGTGSSGSIIGNVADSGTLAFYRNDAVSFDGIVSGPGGVSQIGGGTLTLTAAQTYSGATLISAGTLSLGANSNIAASSAVTADGTFDISATPGTSVKSLAGTGAVILGNQTLSLTSASGTFSGVISGNGGVTLVGGSETLTGLNTYTGATIVSGGTLRLGASSVTNAISDSATVSFYSGSAIAMTGVISGAGIVSQTGNGVTTISVPQTYTGATLIGSGTLALAGSGSIASSSGVADNAILDISAAAAGGVSLVTLSGSGAVQLGAQTLTVTNGSGSFSGGIAGTGGFTLAGGNETLSGASTFTGITTVSSGTLYLANSTAIATSARVVDNAALDISGATNSAAATTVSIQSLGGSGGVILGNRTLILTNAGDNFAGVISGLGGVTVAGGTQVLGGANTYTGATTITAGVLALSGTGSLAATGTLADSGIFDISASTALVSFASLSGSGAVTLGARTLTLNNAADAFSGTISGTGGVTLNGGTQILSGANNYTGGTVINAGTLQIGAGTAAGLFIGNVADNGTLAFNRSDSASFSGVVSGTGGIVQLGVGTAILTAANTYSGGTVVAAGTLQLGNGGTTGSIAGDITDNGTLAFDHSDAIVFGGTISGTGGLSQIGNGTLTLTAVSPYAGTTLINGGAILALTGAASIAASAHVTDNGVLDLSALTTAPRLASLGGTGAVALGAQTLTIMAGADTFSGVLGGAGGLSVTGGTQVLAGINTYSGATSIGGGTLTVNGSIASSSGITVASGGANGGTLSGSGTTSAVAVAGGGTLAPGAAGAGILKINGNLTMASGSALLVNMSSASSPSVLVSGSAALAGTLSVASTDGTYRLGQKMAVLTATGGVSGSYALAQIAGTGAQFKSAVSYDANNVYLEVDLAKLSPLLPTTATVNQARAVSGIDAAIAAGNTLPTAFQNLGTVTSTALGSDAGQLSGEIGAGIPQAGRALLQPFMDAIFDHLGNARRNVWAQAFAGSDLVMGNASAGSHNLKSHALGFVGGADWQVAPGFALGAALSAGSNTFHVAGGLGTGKADGFQAGLYGRMAFTPRLYGSFAGLLAVDDVTTSRTLSVSGTDQLNATLKPFILGGRYETGLKLGWLAPYAAVEDVFTRMPGYAETAASGASSFALQYAARNANSADLELGARQSAALPLGRFWTLTVSDRLAWSHALAVGWSADSRFAALTNSGFTAYGARPGRDAALLSLGAGLRNRNGLGLDMRLESNVSARSQSYTGIAGLNFAW